MPERELIEPNGDKRFIRRDDKGRITESADVSKSLSRDAQQHAENKKPKNQGDKGD